MILPDGFKRMVAAHLVGAAPLADRFNDYTRAFAGFLVFVECEALAMEEYPPDQGNPDARRRLRLVHALLAGNLRLEWA